jgi:demethylmenaquinone methyltransferase/2-methoxy-6-polyprenyl-1,4-benzoquinol methylase
MPVSELESAEAQAAAAGGDAKRAYVQRIFSQIAPRYDLLNHLLSFNIDKAWRRRAIASLNWERAPRGTYVDLCAGTLDVATELSARPGFQGSIVGADFAEPMLRAGRGKAPAAVVAPVVADALDLPLADNSTSGAIVAFGIRNVVD